MDILIQWEKMKIESENIIKDARFLIEHRESVGYDILEQAGSLVKFLSNENTLKENIDNEDMHQFLTTASKIMKQAREDLENQMDIDCKGEDL